MKRHPHQPESPNDGGNARYGQLMGASTLGQAQNFASGKRTSSSSSSLDAAWPVPSGSSPSSYLSSQSSPGQIPFQDSTTHSSSALPTNSGHFLTAQYHPRYPPPSASASYNSQAAWSAPPHHQPNSHSQVRYHQPAVPASFSSTGTIGKVHSSSGSYSGISQGNTGYAHSVPSNGDYSDHSHGGSGYSSSLSNAWFGGPSSSWRSHNVSPQQHSTHEQQASHHQGPVPGGGLVQYLPTFRNEQAQMSSSSRQPIEKRKQATSILTQSQGKSHATRPAPPFKVEPMYAQMFPMVDSSRGNAQPRGPQDQSMPIRSESRQPTSSVAGYRPASNGSSNQSGHSMSPFTSPVHLGPESQALQGGHGASLNPSRQAQSRAFPGVSSSSSSSSSTLKWALALPESPPVASTKGHFGSAASAILESPDPLNLFDMKEPAGYHPAAFYVDPSAAGSPRPQQKRKVENLPALQPGRMVQPFDDLPKKKKKKSTEATRPAPPSSGSIVEVVIPTPPRSQLPSSQRARPRTPERQRGHQQIYVDIPAVTASSKRVDNSQKRQGLAPVIFLDSDSDKDADGSDWEDLNMLENWGTPTEISSNARSGQLSGAGGRVSTGPVKTSARRVPMAKLRGFIEDLFEADDTLPDADTVREMMPGQAISGPAEQFFEIAESPSSHGRGTSVVVLKAAVLQKLLKLVRQCSKPLTEMTGPSRITESGKSMDLSSIPLQDLGRLLGILERTVKVSEDLDPFPAQNKSKSNGMAGSKKKGKKSKGKDRGDAPASPSKSPEAGDENESDIEHNGEKAADADGDSTPLGSLNGAAQPEDINQALESLNAKLTATVRSVLAAECCMATLTGDQLPKPLLSEDLIRTCFDAVKVSLDKVVLPFIEGCGGASYLGTNPLLSTLITALAPQKARKKKSEPVDDPAVGLGALCRNTLARLFRHTCSALYLVQRLVKMPHLTLSDSIVISAVYFGQGPFFVNEPESASASGSSETAKLIAAGKAALASLGGTNAMNSLRTPALNLLRNIFAKHAEQRQWVIEEILTSLTKLTDMKKNRRHYSLRNGKSIHSITALLLQLVQAAAHGVQQQASAVMIEVAQRQQRRAEQTNGSQIGSEDGKGHDVDLDGEDEVNAEMSVWRKGLEGAHQSAKAMVLYLLQRTGQTKISKSSQEMSYAIIIENLIQDLLNVLYLPEWPAAALLLNSFCRIFGTCLEDHKGNPDTKGLALDHLGTIAARIRSSQKQLTSTQAPRHVSAGSSFDHKVDDEAPPQSWDDLSLAKAMSTFDSNAVKKLAHAYKAILLYLSRVGSDEQATEGSVEFVIAQAQGELATAHSRISSLLDQAIEQDAPSLEIAKLHQFQKALEMAVRQLSSWVPSESDLFSAITDDDTRKTIRIMERITISSSINVSYDFMHGQLVDALDGQSVGNRSKALRGLGSISAVDPDLLDNVTVRSAVEVRLRDSSSSVREAAVALFAKYVLRKPEHIEQYYNQLAGRIYDAGLSVRKRVLKLLESIHFASNSKRIQIDACARIIRCVNDEDKIVQELAVATIGKMWLSLEIGGGAAEKNTKQRGGSAPDAVDRDGSEALGTDGDDEATSGGRKKLSGTVDVIMAVAGIIRERPSPLEEVFRRLHKDRKSDEANELLSKLQELSDSMIDSLVESNDGSTLEVVNRIKTVQLLVSTNPSILTINKAKLLLPYLKAAQTPEEMQILELLLKIFRACLPWMPKTALAFAEALEKSLTPLVSRPPAKANLQSLQELIACFCTVIVSHTHNYRILNRTLKACYTKLQQMRAAAASGKKVEEIKSWSMLMSLTALLCEYADFDDIRSKNLNLKAEVDSISPKPIVDAVSETLLTIYETSEGTVRSAALQNLGFIFRAYPSLMTRGSITSVMDEIFDKGTLPERTMLLKIILEFLNADSERRNPDALVAPGVAKKRAEEDSSVDMTVLVGNTESFADTGVGSAMMQRYSDPVLKATLETTNPVLQRTATDILKFSVMQGLSHPIQCVPYLVALETTDDSSLRAKALQLHSHLASKHGSLVQARFLDSARAAFRFQLKQATPQSVRGYQMESTAGAMLNAWYSLLRDRRVTRLDFLRQIVKALDVNTAATDCDIDDVLFARFIADNLATLDYKTLEELFVVIGELRAILAVSGMQILFMIQSQVNMQQTGPEGMRSHSMNGDSSPPRENAHLTGKWQLELASTDGKSSSQSGFLSQTGAHGGGSDESTQAPSIKAQALARMSIISGTALLLRNHLKTLYNLPEAKCAKFNPSKKQSAGADRPAVQRNLHDPQMGALQFDSMPLGLNLVENDSEAQEQMRAYATMVENEGTMMEPEDSEMMEELAL